MHILLVAFTLGGSVAGQMVLGIPLGFAILPILSFSLDVCGYRSRVSKNTITYCVTGHHLYLPRSSVGLFIAYFFCCCLLDNRVQRTGELVWCWASEAWKFPKEFLEVLVGDTVQVRKGPLILLQDWGRITPLSQGRYGLCLPLPTCEKALLTLQPPHGHNNNFGITSKVL